MAFVNFLIPSTHINIINDLHEAAIFTYIDHFSMLNIQEI